MLDALLHFADTASFITLIILAFIALQAGSYYRDSPLKHFVVWLTATVFITYFFYRYTSEQHYENQFQATIRALLVGCVSHGLLLYLVLTISWLIRSLHHFQRKQARQSQEHRQHKQQAKQKQREYRLALRTAKQLEDVPSSDLRSAVATVAGKFSPQLYIAEMLGLNPKDPEFKEDLDVWRLSQVLDIARESAEAKAMAELLRQVAAFHDEHLFELQLPDILGLDPESHESKQLRLASEQKLMRRLKQLLFSD